MTLSMQCEAAQLEACALWALGRSNLEADPSVSSWIKVLWEKHGNTSWPWLNFQSQTFPTSWPWLQTSPNHKCAKPEKLHWQLLLLNQYSSMLKMWEGRLHFPSPFLKWITSAQSLAAKQRLATSCCPTSCCQMGIDLTNDPGALQARWCENSWHCMTLRLRHSLTFTDIHSINFVHFYAFIVCIKHVSSVKLRLFPSARGTWQHCPLLWLLVPYWCLRNVHPYLSYLRHLRNYNDCPEIKIRHFHVWWDWTEVMSTVGLGDINMDLVNERGLLCLIMSAAQPSFGSREPMRPV